MDRYGKIEDGVLTIVPMSGMVGNIMCSKLTDEQHRLLGHKKVVEVWPDLGPGQEAAFDRYDETEDEIRILYKAETPADNLKISKIKLRIALARAGLWEKMQQHLGQMNMEIAPGVSISGMDVWNDALIIDFGDPQFEPFLENIKTLFADVLTEDQISGILAACRAE